MAGKNDGALEKILGVNEDEHAGLFQKVSGPVLPRITSRKAEHRLLQKQGDYSEVGMTQDEKRVERINLYMRKIAKD